MSTPDNRNYEPKRGDARPDFFIDSVLDQAASEREGRQIWKDEVRVKVYNPGNNLSIPTFKVTDSPNDEWKMRWPEQYKAFMAGIEPPVDGMPIEQWPQLTKSHVKELRYLNIRTVEDLAGMADVTLQKLGMGGMALRDLAKAYLDDSQKHALENKLTKLTEAQSIKIAALENQIAELAKIATSQNTQLMQMRDAPNPLATMIPAASIQNVPKAEPQEHVTSSLDKLAKRKPGRPSKASKETEGKAA